jgi:hypothetical protein
MKCRMAWLVTCMATLGAAACAGSGDIEPAGGAGGTADGGEAARCAGGTPLCTEAGECSAATSSCVAAACDHLCCSTRSAVATTRCAGGVCDGSGACVGCVTDSDCVASDTPCATAACNDNTCGVSFAVKGTACPDDHGWVCDGMGMCVACNVAADCRPQSSACLVNTCSGNACGKVNAPEGTVCADGAVCSVSGWCVQCNLAGGCRGTSI